jgi:PAS domain S-box-containing protein
MAIAPELVGAGQFVTAVVAALFFKPIYENRETPGAREFGVFIAGTVLWGTGLAAGNVITNPELSVGVYRIVLLGAEMASVGWFLTAMTVVRGNTVSRRTAGTVIVWVLMMQGLIWTNPLHHFVLSPGYVLEGAVLVPQPRLGFWVHTGVSYALVLIGTGRLGLEAVRSTGLRQKQMALLGLSVLPSIAGTLLTLSDTLFAPYDVSPLGYLVSAVLIALVLFEGRFLDVTTVARRTVMDQMDDAVVTLDGQDRVIDANRTALDLFGIDEGYTGLPATEFFIPVLQDTRAPFAGLVDVKTEVTATINGQRRHFLMSVSSVGENAASGRVFVLREITKRKQREQRLQRQNDRLDRVTSVISHDLRSPLNVNKLTLDLLASDYDDERIQKASRATEHAKRMIDDLLTLAEQGQVVDEPETAELAPTVHKAWQSVRTDDSTLTVGTELGAVTADHGRLRQAFENLFRNAVDHNDGPLGITVGRLEGDRDDAADEDGFFIADDGHGIPEDVREDVFHHGYTTADSGTGLGLSIVREYLFSEVPS